LLFNKGYFYIFATIFFTVYGQLILKWRIIRYGDVPEQSLEKFVFLGRLLFDPFIISGFGAAFIAALCWMGAMTKFDLSYAYPFVSITFVFVLFLSASFFQEPITMPKIIGMVFIIAGIIIGAQG
jgi:multidrug transporter EmrE-like cation transporter